MIKQTFTRSALFLKVLEQLNKKEKTLHRWYIIPAFNT